MSATSLPVAKQASKRLQPTMPAAGHGAHGHAKSLSDLRVIQVRKEGHSYDLALPLRKALYSVPDIRGCLDVLN
jgi:hypothetical protein